MLSDADRILLTTGAEELGVRLDSTGLARFELYAERLHAVNEQMNLTRIPPEQTVTLHFLDSLTLVRVARLRTGSKVLDMGTGAGFPGLPLAIVSPEISVTLADATYKRLSFLDSLINELNIHNVRLVHGRAEELCRTNLQHSFDLVTARAVAKMDRLAKWMIPFVAPGGYAIAFKSETAREEIEGSKNALEILGGRLERIEEVTLPGSEILRLLAVVSVGDNAAIYGKHWARPQRGINYVGSDKQEI